MSLNIACILTCGLARQHQWNLIHQLRLGHTLEDKFYNAVASRLMSTDHNGEVGRVGVVPVHYAALETVHISKLDVGCFDLREFEHTQHFLVIVDIIIQMFSPCSKEVCTG